MRFTESATLHTRRGRQPLSLKTARGFWSRFRGLMFAQPLGRGPRPQALLLLRCPSVHGFFMRGALDVVYLGRARPSSELDQRAEGYIVTHAARLEPWRVSLGKRWAPPHESGLPVLRSRHALELPAGSIEALGIAPGDRLELHAWRAISRTVRIRLAHEEPT